MILTIVTIDIKKGQNESFEKALLTAQGVLSRASGCLGYEFQHCVEKGNEYILMVRWETIAAHTDDFLSSELFLELRSQIEVFFAKSPQVLHYYSLIPNKKEGSA